MNGTMEMKMQQQPSVAALSPHSGSGLSLMGIAQREWPLLGSIATAAAFLLFGQRWLADLSNPIWLAFLLLWLFGVVLFVCLLASALGVRTALKIDPASALAG